ncbi:MAG: translation initiation factor IF-1 [Candidatus Improbicoccus pseudotrichonymphae]|uniref:Translation initiation factor IF-1 n=1 Tax=Candidatus Improbicoccus pseudotrichonymphae TaxID=3033792 RepID=A0AA48IGN6_9FIRM|nr:MAG: translation initiation factor IF-1 [Candidatus Improbicoccus pseudotrichonymphae]
MAKDNLIEMEGKVVKILPNACFEVELLLNGSEEKRVVLCTLSGKLRMNNIRVLLGDSVKVEVSTYGLTRGRIIWRSKNK